MIFGQNCGVSYGFLWRDVGGAGCWKRRAHSLANIVHSRDLLYYTALYSSSGREAPVGYDSREGAGEWSRWP